MNNRNIIDKELVNLRSITQIAAHYDGLEVRSVRHFVNERKFNGLNKSGAVYKIGTRVYLDLPVFDSWLRTHIESEEIA